jgi:hypothetical protein
MKEKKKVFEVTDSKNKSNKFLIIALSKEESLGIVNQHLSNENNYNIHHVRELSPTRDFLIFARLKIKTVNTLRF